ncbi:hypothetical protein AQUCO_04900094v1 [Aquilegia coerulea]|uniref:F-box associated beta-propeller type 3 domain-containing protein n=1 Tax=Aquilegia coerulea TaxID=218851 RepID=A0A2G5CJU6_AQUCA|nr:hypothetical protein AQUCO_04900094v1 [Aquilegia coerulea]
MLPIYGFGYNSIIDDYKVVKIKQFFRGDNIDFISSEVMVYTLGTDSWKVIDGAPYSICCTSPLPSFENIHWAAKKNPDYLELDSIVCFNLVSEKISETQFPKRVGKIIRAGVLGGCLSILCRTEENQAEVWVMKDYGINESWTKVISINHMTVIRSVDQLEVLCYSMNGNVLMKSRYSDLVSYDPYLEESRTLEIKGAPINWDPTVIYVGSLVSLNSCTYVGQEQAMWQTGHNKRLER